MSKPMGVPKIVSLRTQLQGIKLYYERRSSDDVWGDLAPEEQADFWFKPKFAGELDACFLEIKKVFGHRVMQGIITAGAWVDKPGMHKEARAFDLDGIVWKDGKWKADEFITIENRRVYLVIQAICMKHFGTVLGYLYNKAHEDHIHMDDGTEPGFRHNSRSVVTFIQEVYNYYIDNKLKVDGSWGPKTWKAMKRILNEGLLLTTSTQYPTEAQYFLFLDWVIRKGFKKEEKPSIEKKEEASKIYQLLHEIDNKVGEIRKLVRLDDV